MDDAILNFQQMMLELPDADQDLALQAAGKVLDQFTLFPNLPVEVRLMIWRLTFPPGRKVRLRRRLLCRSAKHDEFCTCIPQHVDLPVTLFINQESRSETLKSYRVLTTRPGATPSLNGTPQPLCIDTSKDTPQIMLEADAMTHGSVEWFQNIIDYNPGCFHKVKVLEVHDWLTDPSAPSAVLYANLLAILSIFPNLEKIRLYLSQYYVGDALSQRIRCFGIQVPWTDLDESFTKWVFKLWADEKQRSDPGFKAPRISIHYWSKIEMKH